MTAPEQPQIVTFSQMKGAIGSLVLLWSRIEMALAEAIQSLPDEVAKDAHGIRRSIDVWERYVMSRGSGEEPLSLLCQRLVARLKHALDVRNQVCHGLIGITGQVSASDPEAHLTVRLKGKRKDISWSELQSMFSWMSRAGHLICDLTHVALADDPRQEGRTLLIAWQDFPTQR
ncbi:hypothetical protein L0V05_20375 [Tabrizicola sp. J26]|uniref:hypothetical protein n=1 Tax=Alitabrizicola rongguiensis TaxID=2909234 RepID=UPI001F4268C7|nr:hypothetical protein [Tabrizicola rongguiensis]MCF1711166.1 hypothetical protein [Tabrizicola rongguiensis]